MRDEDRLDAGHSGVSLDAIVRDVLPEVKLSLGETIDRENARALPGRYARLLPETLLVVTLRPDAAEELASIAPAIERELTDSCMRHGSLYDRAYRVQLRRSADPDAPLFAVATFAGHETPADAEQPAAGHAADAGAPVEQDAEAAPTPIPAVDPDATRVDGWEPPRWDAGRWMLVVEGDGGEEREAFRLADPVTTVGRRSDDPSLRVGVGLSGAPHVSRRQLALVWDGETPVPGFRVVNLGLNPIHVQGREVPGAKLGRGPLDLAGIDPAHALRVEAGTTLRIGDAGPQLRIVEVPPGEDDPEATQYG
jgi:hypothetical protein